MAAWANKIWRTAGPTVPVDCTILDANSRQSLVTARALGRAGLSVALVETEERVATDPVLSLVLRHIPHGPAQHPQEVGDDFGEAVLDLLERQPTTVLIPALDASIAALRPHRGRIEALTTLALASEASLCFANDKTKTLGLAEGLGLRIPRSTIIDKPSEVVDALAHTGLPAVIKPAQSWVWGETSGSRLLARDVLENAEQKP